MLDKCEWCDKTSAQIDSLEFELESLKNYQLHAQDDLTNKDKELEAKDQEIDELKELILFKDKFLVKYKNMAETIFIALNFDDPTTKE